MFDLHVHSAPCVLPRLADDGQTVGWYERAGFAGCVLKGHYEPTTGRAATAGAGSAVSVYGGIVLNHAVGGLNPSAVDAALALGARVVWMPTLDALGHRESGLPRPQEASSEEPLAIPPRDSRNEEAVRRIVASVAESDVLLATGHLSGPEVGWLVQAAREAGARRILVTHATFTVPALGPPELRELTDLGASIELTAYQLLHQQGWDGARLAAAARSAGLDRVVLSSDAGQPDSPPPPEALLRLVAALTAAGLDPRAVEAMASELPQALVEPD